MIDLNFEDENFMLLKNIFESKNDSDVKKRAMEEFIQSLENKMQSWLNKFGWDRNALIDKFKDHDDYLDCPYNNSHRKIKKKNYDKHVNRCRVKQMGNFSKQDLVLYFLWFFIYSSTS